MTRACILCGFDLTPVELGACRRCVSEVRRGLAGIDAGFALLRVQVELVGMPAAVTLGTVMGVGNDDVAVPDALVMLGPGAASHEGDPSDPPPVAFELWTWAGDWCEIRREDPARVPADVPGLVAFLNLRLGWAMSYHPAADEFAADVRRIRLRLDAVTGTLDVPERGESCPYCGGTLEREYGPAGRVDDWCCPRCHRAFNEAQYRLAVRAALEAPLAKPG